MGERRESTRRSTSNWWPPYLPPKKNGGTEHRKIRLVWLRRYGVPSREYSLVSCLLSFGTEILKFSIPGLHTSPLRRLGSGRSRWGTGLGPTPSSSFVYEEGCGPLLTRFWGLSGFEVSSPTRNEEYVSVTRKKALGVSGLYRRSQVPCRFTRERGVLPTPSSTPRVGREVSGVSILFPPMSYLDVSPCLSTPCRHYSRLGDWGYSRSVRAFGSSDLLERQPTLLGVNLH